MATCFWERAQHEHSLDYRKESNPIKSALVPAMSTLMQFPRPKIKFVALTYTFHTSRSFLADPLSGFQNTPLADFQTLLAGVHNLLAGVHNPFSGFPNSLVDFHDLGNQSGSISSTTFATSRQFIGTTGFFVK
jgi:hypothetical protein